MRSSVRFFLPFSERRSDLLFVPATVMTRRKVMLILPPAFARLGIECSHSFCVRPRMTTRSPSDSVIFSVGREAAGPWPFVPMLNDFVEAGGISTSAGAFRRR